MPGSLKRMKDFSRRRQETGDVRRDPVYKPGSYLKAIGFLTKEF
jgi:hypothetical protein